MHKGLVFVLFACLAALEAQAVGADVGLDHFEDLAQTPVYQITGTLSCTACPDCGHCTGKSGAAVRGPAFPANGAAGAAGAAGAGGAGGAGAAGAGGAGAGAGAGNGNGASAALAIAVKELAHKDNKLQKQLRKVLRKMRRVVKDNKRLHHEISHGLQRENDKINKIHFIQGAPGPQGPKGDRGRRGRRGPMGNPGTAGPRGNPGARGAPGNTGAVGAPGPAGPRGPAGIAGPVGSTGAPGPAGKPGTDGKRGARGDRGARGAPGPAGNPGRDGKPGQSIRGPPGERGRDGRAGATGPKGSPGPPGAAGRDGTRGPPGSPGRTGAPGNAGPRGAPGSAGPAGARGNPGAPGPRGLPGKNGRDGSGGGRGLPGPTGPRGQPGPPGPKGSQGIAGIRGAPGHPGASGGGGGRGGGLRHGAIVEQWDTGGPGNLNTPWISPNHRFLYRKRIINIQAREQFETKGERVENFSLRYRFQVKAHKAAKYTFFLTSDDGSGLYHNGHLVVNDDGWHGPQTRSGTVDLKKGFNEFNLRMFQGGGGAMLKLQWSGPGVDGQDFVPIYAPSNYRAILKRKLAKFGMHARLWLFGPGPNVLAEAFRGKPDKVWDLDKSTIEFGDPGSFQAGQSEHFSVEYTGYIVAPIGGNYHFWIASDDGSDLYIDGSKIVDNDGPHGQQWRDGTVDLSRGSHKFKARMFQYGGGANFIVDWAGPGFDRQRMPVMIRPEEGVKPGKPPKYASGMEVKIWNYNSGPNNLAEAFRGPPSIIRDQTNTAIEFGDPGSFQAGQGEHFAAKYTGYILIKKAGTYHFWIASDDGSRLYIDGDFVVDDDGLHGQQWRDATVDLKVGAHKVKAVMFQNGGGANFIVDWAGPGFDRQRMPILRRLPARSRLMSGMQARIWNYNSGPNNLAEAFNGPPKYVERLSYSTIDFENQNTFGAGRDEHFSVEYTGFIITPKKGNYHFWIASDDGSRLFVDGKQVVDDDGLHGQQWRDGTIDLKKGKIGFKALMFQNGGGANFIIDWAGPGFDRRRMPVFFQSHGVKSVGKHHKKSKYVPGMHARIWKFGNGPNNLAEAFNGDPARSENLDNPTIDFEDPGSFGIGQNEHFSVEYTGVVIAPRAGMYHFWIASDDGSRLYIDDKQTVDDDGLHGQQWRDAGLELSKGVHKFKAVMFQNGGGANFIVDWSGPGFDRARMPVMRRRGGGGGGGGKKKPGMHARIWNFGNGPNSLAEAFNGNPVKEMDLTKPTIDFQDPGSFQAGQNEHFSVEYTGVIHAPKDGGYHFWIASDDGSRLYIDDKQVVDDDGLHGQQWRDAGTDLKEGTHKFKAVMFQNGGGANFIVDWSGPGFDRQRMPVFLGGHKQKAMSKPAELLQETPQRTKRHALLSGVHTILSWIL